ncbi:MAG: glycosyltransferase family 2 protein [Bacteroidaceae bacterium]|nr:glycosyltransferase family 2 protein [Bacteroidaceae bacterium]
MISIIVPVYNAENFLRRCIDSILIQSYTDFELLLINDGSKDASGAICDEYAAKDSRVRVFHKGNGGVSSARNLGLDNAQGDYITFCDADDYVGTEWLAAFCDAMEQKVDFIVQGFYKVVGDDTVENVLPPLSGTSNEQLQELIKRLVTSSCFGYIWVCAFRSELIESYKIRFDENSAFTEDAQFIAKCLEYTASFEYVGEANYYYIAPDIRKKYVDDTSYSVIHLCWSLRTIFNGCLPIEFCSRYFRYIKDGAPRYVLSGKRLDENHIVLYKEMVNTLGLDKGLKNKIRNFLIIESPRLRSLSVLGLKLIKMIS